MELAIILVFVMGYLAITLEHNIKLDKLIPASSNDGHLLGISFFRN